MEIEDVGTFLCDSRRERDEGVGAQKEAIHAENKKQRCLTCEATAMTLYQ